MIINARVMCLALMGLMFISAQSSAADVGFINGFLNDNVLVFDKSGNFSAELSVKDFLASGRTLPLAIHEVDDSHGLLLVDGPSGPVWIGEEGLKTTIERKSVIVCTNAPKVKVADTVTAAAMGLSTCSK